MNIKLLDLDINSAGEYLRNIVFPKQREDDRGCYSTFKVANNFKECDKNKYKFLLYYLNECDYVDNDDNYFIDDNPHIYSYESDELVCMWYWDGDGVLLIYSKSDNVIYLNRDCKKDYTWKRYSTI